MLRYAAFGLGSTNYQHFHRVVDADDVNGGTEQDFCLWKDRLFAHLDKEVGIKGHKDTYSRILAETDVNFGRLLELASSQDDGQTWSALRLSLVLEALPKLRPRYYSISSPSVLPLQALGITALVSNQALHGEGGSIPGLTTSYLLAGAHTYHDIKIQPNHLQNVSYELTGPSAELQERKIFAHLRRSAFKLPALASCPVIMLAAGTGIAPSRAFIAERARLESIGRPVGNMMLFFGCRSPKEDCLHQAELEEMETALGGKLRIIAVFSRLTAKKAYI
ncbi:hypothetical protein HIM_06277 [Hirsutella minnesotensis 3608]|uniref:FAD-binding FR-type domain-containing protein n=1 Tax=Hirsutella minnesotensis 3608 TaxID=1043627 RepID=A0A0F7ZJB6_9HYPO|nr:hypothetical protein HIM_06277 [Hirsutella minnesotensis 3608]